MKRSLRRGLPSLSAAALITLALSVALPLRPRAQQTQGAFSVNVEAVRVDVLVSDGGRPVRGLTAGDFEVRDNGVPQTVDFVSFEQLPLNVVLALDMSSSIAGERLAALQRAGATLLSTLTPSDQAALVTFSHRVAVPARLSPNLDAVRQALAASSGAGDTAMLDGIYTGLAVAESDVGRGLLIVFGDGVDTASWLTADRLTDASRRTDATVYAVVPAGRQKTEPLAEIASLTGGRVFGVENINNLERIFVDILNEFRTRYLLSYTPTGVPAGGWHTLDVRVKGRRATVSARPGYIGRARR
jgi:VWFA-related protein